MKNIILYSPILLIFIIFSCSSNKYDMDEIQDYTSFVVAHKSGNYTTKNVVIGYKLNDGKWKRLSAYDVVGITESKETVIDYNVVKHVVLFRDYQGADYVNYALIICEYDIKENVKNVLYIPDIYDGSNLVNKTDNTEYPIE